MSDERESLPRLKIPLRDPHTNKVFFPGADPDFVWRWYTALQNWGFEAVLDMIKTSLFYVEVDFFEEETERLEALIRAIQLYGQQVKSEEESILSTSYYMLRQKDWTRAQAANFASTMLGHEIAVDTWRKRVDKYIRENNKPPIELPHGRPSNKNRKTE